MRIAIFGTGALGSLFGARLAATNTHEVTLTGTWQAAIDAIATHGLRIAGDDGTATVRATAARREQLGARTFDLVLVLVKSWQTSGVAATAARAAGADGTVVTLQNGLGNAEALARYVDPARLVLGVTTLGASLDRPGYVRPGGDGTTTLAPFGVGGAHVDRLRPLRDAMAGAAIPCRIVADGRPLVWQKLAVSCALNPLAALSGRPNGDLVASPGRRALVRAIAGEVAAVAAARGIVVDDPGGRAIAVARATAANRNSMLQDADAGRRTEIGALSGAVAEEALRVGIDAPLNRTLADRVRAFEHDGFPSSRGFALVEDLVRRAAA